MTADGANGRSSPEARDSTATPGWSPDGSSLAIDSDWGGAR